MVCAVKVFIVLKTNVSFNSTSVNVLNWLMWFLTQTSPQDLLFGSSTGLGLQDSRRWSWDALPKTKDWWWWDHKYLMSLIYLIEHVSPLGPLQLLTGSGRDPQIYHLWAAWLFWTSERHHSYIHCYLLSLQIGCSCSHVKV
jgi:hypothetical protein